MTIAMQPYPSHEPSSAQWVQLVPALANEALQMVGTQRGQLTNQLYKQFVDNPSFKQWLSDFVFRTTYLPPSPGPS